MALIAGNRAHRGEGLDAEGFLQGDAPVPPHAQGAPRQARAQEDHPPVVDHLEGPIHRDPPEFVKAAHVAMAEVVADGIGVLSEE